MRPLAVAAADTAGVALWQAGLGLLGAVLTVLFGVLLISRHQADSLGKALDGRINDLDKRLAEQIAGIDASLKQKIEGLESTQRLEVARVGDAVTTTSTTLQKLDGRVESFTTRLDRVIEQQSASARELSALGTSLRDLLDARLESINRLLLDMAKRVDHLERRETGRPDPFA